MKHRFAPALRRFLLPLCCVLMLLLLLVSIFAVLKAAKGDGTYDGEPCTALTLHQELFEENQAAFDTVASYLKEGLEQGVFADGEEIRMEDLRFFSTLNRQLDTPDKVEQAAMTLDAQVSGYFFVRIYSRQIVFRTPACTEHCWVRTFDPLPPAAVFDGNTDFDSLSLTENWYIAVRRLET